MNGFPAHGFSLLCVCVCVDAGHCMCVSVLLSHWPDKPSLILSEDQCATGHTHTHTHTIHQQINMHNLTQNDSHRCQRSA